MSRWNLPLCTCVSESERTNDGKPYQLVDQIAKKISSTRVTEARTACHSSVEDEDEAGVTLQTSEALLGACGTPASYICLSRSVTSIIHISLRPKNKTAAAYDHVSHTQDPLQHRLHAPWMDPFSSSSIAATIAKNLFARYGIMVWYDMCGATHRPDHIAMIMSALSLKSFPLGTYVAVPVHV